MSKSRNMNGGRMRHGIWLAVGRVFPFLLFFALRLIVLANELTHDVLIFTGNGVMGREVVNIRSSNIVVILGGRSGTLGKLAIGYNEGKLIGALMGTGGITDIVEPVPAASKTETVARILYLHLPRRPIEWLLKVYRREHYRHSSIFCRRNSVTSTTPIEGSRATSAGHLDSSKSLRARASKGLGMYVVAAGVLVNA
ncbi:MAG: hypothetical protein KF851_15700 [Pirellulaceae bacterium]|nr:hypothetical protein [Pirellulaceae bacterium]